MRILVEVAGGCVTGVYCSDVDATLFIIDHDHLEELVDIAGDLDELTVDGGDDDIIRIMHEVREVYSFTEVW